MKRLLATLATAGLLSSAALLAAAGAAHADPPSGPGLENEPIVIDAGTE
jgi:hypothetical protein